MAHKTETPFDNIESAHEYLRLLSETLQESKQEIERDIVAQSESNQIRHVDALRLVLYKLERLDHHMTAGQRVLNDLRTLRRLLLHEREAMAVAPAK